MSRWRRRLAQDDGWTIIEAVLTIVLGSIMALGLAITLLAFKEQIDRSWAVRLMDQTANNIIEQMTQDLRNSVDVTVRGGTGNTSRIECKILDPLRKSDAQQTVLWRADPRQVRFWRGNQIVEKDFPPTKPGYGESYQIVRFTVSTFGANKDNEPWARVDMPSRQESFVNAMFDINLTMRYSRTRSLARKYDWTFEKEYTNRVYARNMNLIIKKGVTGSE